MQHSVVNKLLDNGFNTCFIVSPLELAFQNDCSELIHLFLDHGAGIPNLNLQKLIIACKCGHLEAARLQLERVPDVDVDVSSDDQPVTVLAIASSYGHHEVVRLLMDRGADVHANDDLALKVATEKGHHEVVRVLLERGGDFSDLTIIDALVAMHPNDAKVARLLLYPVWKVVAKEVFKQIRSGFGRMFART